MADRVAEQVFAGGGELGARMRAMDWSATALGPVETWPQSLRTCIRILLTSRQPMFVWWGPQLINLYNDAYKAIVGGKHPAALGQPASHVWHEIWAQVGPRAEHALRTNEGTYDESLLLIMERNGYPEETYYTFSYSPVPSEGGTAGGIFCANTDGTQEIIRGRQLALLRELAAQLANARTEESVLAVAAAALALNRHDLPVSAIYLLDAERRAFERAGGGDGALPERIAADSPLGARCVAAIAQRETFVVDTDPAAPLPGGAWAHPPRQLAYVPLAPSTDAGRPGVLAVALNPFRLFDVDYRGFVELAAGQLAAALANARAYELERRRAEALAELDRAKTAFFSNVSHELRTPLALMLGPQEDALASGEPLGGHALSTVHRNTRRLLKLVNSLLDFARIEAGRVQAQFVPTDLAALTRDLASGFEAAVARAGLAYRVDLPPLAADAFVDHDMWEKIVLNLLSNALKYTFDGSISVALAERGGAIELTVADTGVGVPASELPRLFERFYRVEGSRARSHEGTGIGLALVRDLAGLHGGEVRVASEVDRGTTFTVSIPAGSAHLPADRIAAAPAHGDPSRAGAYLDEVMRWLPGGADATADEPITTAPRTSVARVLVADDNADMREYIARLLRDAGMAVETVRDGAEALAALRAAPADLVISDVMMPNVDGFALLRAVRGDLVLRETAVLLLSARAGEESRVEGLERGANDYLVKPFSSRELIARAQSQVVAARVRGMERSTRRRFAELFARAPVGIALLTGPDHVYELCNPAYLALVNNRDVLGKSLRQALPELEAQGIAELLDGVYATGEPYEHRELKVMLERAAAGRIDEVYFDVVFQPIPESAHEPRSVLVVALDVTSQVVARQRERDALADAESANRAKDEFIAMLSHELRNPLAPILTAIELMRLRAPGVVEREVDVIERQAQHVLRLVEDLLDVSRITRNKIELKRTPIELAEVVARAIEQASPIIEQRKHDLRVDVRARGLAVYADPDRLAQVIANLLTNAAKYTEGGGRIDVTARAADDGMIELAVRDNGIGIAPEFLPHVFETFVQERQALDRSRGGLGLGLAIVKSLVAMHGGTATAHSDGRGHGSTFAIRVPAHAADATAPTPARDAPSKPPGGERHLRILLVDDNEDFANTLAQALTARGNTVRVAYDGPAALRAAAELAPDVAVLDIGLPVMDGYELARLLRAAPGGAARGLVAVTGYGQEGDRARALAAGFDAHVTKPVDATRLDAVIRELPAAR